MDKTVGILGGGQLGLMLTEAANRLNIKVVTLDAPGCPASKIGKLVAGSFRDSQDIKKLASQVDIITTEIEHIDTNALRELSKNSKVDMQPHFETVQTIQDKYAQKEYLSRQGIPVPKCIAVTGGKGGDTKAVAEAVESIGGYPVMLKSRRDAYDGRGNFPLKSRSEIPEAIATLGDKDLYIEAWVPFTMELAVMVVKTEDKAHSDWSSTMTFPVVETVQNKDSICILAYCPPRDLNEKVQRKAREVAQRAVSSFKGKGIFGVEMFLTGDGEILVNEIAPRPHNSGHLTMEACGISQFEAAIRAILDLPIDPTDLEADRAAIMLNILGTSTPAGHLAIQSKAMNISRASVHMYGKDDARPGRKMGHVTITARSIAEAEERIQHLIALVDQLQKPAPSTKHEQPNKTSTLSISTNPKVSCPPRIALTMGSDSDREVLLPAVALLDRFQISYESNITSAHRTPLRMMKWAQELESRKISVVIAAAGGAAHLPGMLASLCNIPVIGVPVKASQLAGVDSLLSIVQMPRGCPVATVGVNNAENAAQLAIRILAISDSEIKKKLDKYLQDQTDEVITKGDRMQELGIAKYSWPPNS